MVMSMYTLLRNNALPSQRKMENAFQGNVLTHHNLRSNQYSYVAAYVVLKLYTNGVLLASLAI